MTNEHTAPPESEDSEPATQTTQAKRSVKMIGAIDNVLTLLRLFESNELLRINEVSRKMNLSRSTVHRMMATLSHHGYVSQDSFSRGYAPGPVLEDIGLAVVQKMDIRLQSRETLESLRDITGETVHLAVLRNSEILFVDGVESKSVVRTGHRIGQTLPACVTASGKALLAEMSDEDIRTLYPDEVLPQLTAESVELRSDLLVTLKQVREDGFSVNHGESEKDVAALAVAVRDSRGRARAALVVTAPRTRVDEDWVERIKNATLTSATTLEERLP